MSTGQSAYTAHSAAFPKARLSENEQEIAELLEISSTPGHWRPDALTLDRNLLDRIVDGGTITEKEEFEILDWTGWAWDIPDAMKWWNNLAEPALEDLFERHHDECDIERRLQALATLEAAFGPPLLFSGDRYLDLTRGK